MTEDTLRLLSLLGARLKNEPRFMAHALDRYCRNNELSETELASNLSASREAIVSLALCHKPDPESPNFEEQVRQIARHTCVDEALLYEIIQTTTPRPVPTAAKQDSTLARLFDLVKIFTLERGAVFGAVAAALLLAIAVSIFFWPHSHGREDLLVKGESREGPEAKVAPEIKTNAGKSDNGRITTSEPPGARNTNSQSAAAAASTPPNRDRNKAQTQQVASAIVGLKFDNRGILRDGGEPRVNNESRIVLKRAVTQLNIELPPGSGAGGYEVSLQDAFGKPVLGTQAKSRNGKSLSAQLDLRGLAPKSYYLCVQRAGNVPDCNSVEILAEK